MRPGKVDFLFLTSHFVKLLADGRYWGVNVLAPKTIMKVEVVGCGMTWAVESTLPALVVGGYFILCRSIYVVYTLYIWHCELAFLCFTHIVGVYTSSFVLFSKEV